MLTSGFWALHPLTGMPPQYPISPAPFKSHRHDDHDDHDATFHISASDTGCKHLPMFCNKCLRACESHDSCDMPTSVMADAVCA